MKVTQGHSYSHHQRLVVALESGHGDVMVRVLPIDKAHVSGLGRAINVHAMALEPLPMKYYGNAIPGGGV